MASGKRASPTKRAKFIAELVANGGNLTQAAVSVGYHPQHGRRLAKDPEVQAALEQATKTVENNITQWAAMQEAARQKMYNLMSSANDERVQLLAAKEIIERHEGKTTAKVEHSGEVTTRVIEDEGTIMAIMTLMGRRGWSLAQAFTYVKANPTEVSEWMRALPAGDDEQIPEAEYTIEPKEE